jgi:hypothetical protein
MRVTPTIVVLLHTVELSLPFVTPFFQFGIKAKLKVARPQNSKQNQAQREAFKKTFQTTSSC